MDPRLLRLYGEELAHLREVGAEFAQSFPKIAGRLGMEGMEVADPYVERLLEGFAFLAARVQLRLDAEHPRLVAHLLESIYPDFLAPVPSMMVAELAADASDPNLARGYTVPRGSALVSRLPRGQDTRCEFRTAHAVTLWPVSIAAASYASHLPDLPASRLPQLGAMRGALRLRLCCGGGTRFAGPGLDRLAVYIAAPDDVAFQLHELLGGALGSWVVAAAGATADPGAGWRGPDSVVARGFGEDEALLPVSLRAFSGHRLLQEVAALPQRLMFFELRDLASRLAAVDAEEVEIVVPLARGQPALEPVVDGASFALHCTPAINLQRKRLDRVLLSPGQWEYHLMPDRTRPIDFEVHHVESVVGHGSGAPREYRALYDTHHDVAPGDAGGYVTRREPRLLSPQQRSKGTRSAYIGEEVYLSLVDPANVADAAGGDEVRQLSVVAWVSNRDLPLLLPQAGSEGASAWQLETPGPVTAVRVLRGPTRPASRLAAGAADWRLVGQLAASHASLHGSPDEAARALRAALELYGAPGDASWARQVGALRSLEVTPVVRRLPFAGPLCFGRGSAVSAEFDELAFQGAGLHLLGSALEHWFSRHAAINSFIEFTLHSTQRGLVRRWAPRLGLRETV
ncbi:MAG: type VI secretion system baseplate subunit TssF [Burkholderiales bacterium]|nr:type VI secretion system baseplate subunit TssF [Burkholderiales bacterium]